MRKSYSLRRTVFLTVSTFIQAILIGWLSWLAPAADAYEVSLSPAFNGGDGAYTVETRASQQVWVGNAYLYFNVPTQFPAGTQAAYVQITYYDQTSGPRLTVQYDSTTAAYSSTAFHIRSSAEGINAFAVSYQRLDSPLFSGRENGGTDFRINTGGIPIQSVVVRDFPFDDPQAQIALSLTPSWKQPYTGPTRDDVNAETIRGKVLAGYQGWFRTPNDLYDGGFSHWTVDMWPDPDDYDMASVKAVPGTTTISGKQGYVFSSADPQVVRQHFKWMRKYNIDGVYLQRFFGSATAGTKPEWTLSFVREAANLEGRVWAIEYDLSGGNDAELVSKITTDWKWLVDTLAITDDARYLHEQGKPVVVLWGAGIRTNLSVDPLNALVDFFKSDPVYGGNYVVGCVSPNFPAAWESNYGRYHSIFAWMGSLQNVADRAAQYGIKAQMHAWPGFSWHNLKQLTFPTQYSDRQGGQFFWNRISSGITTVNPEALFVGMFDEYDESTAVMPMSDDPPILPDPNIGHYITNDGSPKDWWMTLSGYAQDTLCKQIPLSSTMPTQTSLSNRSNIGPELVATLGATNTGNLLQPLEYTGDGNTSARVIAGIDCRRALNNYMYFKVDDTVIMGASAGADVTVVVDYYDTGGGVDLALEYDSVSAPYKAHPKAFSVSSTDTWRTARFEISDAYFGNRQNGGADFRLRSTNINHNLNISRVRVILPDDQSLDWTAQDIGSVGIAGSSTLLRGVFTIQASGSDIWGTADAFRLVNLPANGDCTITARVTSISNTHVWAKAGVMIRETTTAGSKHAMTVITPGSGCSFQRRKSTGASSLSTTVSGTAPGWVRITRKGNVFTSYRSTDGATWTQIGSDIITMASNAQIGLCVTSHNNSAICTAVFDNASVTP
jgi:regulation of enolase protein 1 (concanavalin A-like superfamily)